MEVGRLDDVPLQGKLVNQKLLKTELQVEKFIQDICKCEVSKSEVTKLHFAARKAIMGIKSDLQVLNDIKEQEDSDTAKEAIESFVSRHKKLLMTLQIDLRKANITAEDKLTSMERDELFVRSPDETANSSVRRRGHNKDKALKVTSNITSDLIKIAEMMSTQVEHGIESTSLLEESSKNLTQTQEEYKGMTGFIQMSKKLINKYNRRQLTDTLLIFFGLLLFFTTVLYIILKRL